MVVIRGWDVLYNVFPNINTLIDRGDLNIEWSNSTVGAIKMYDAGRAPLLFGSDTFDWYYNHLSLVKKTRNFRPLLTIPSGILISKESKHHDEILRRFNLAYKQFKDQGNFDKDNFLNPSLMNEVYQEPPRQD